MRRLITTTLALLLSSLLGCTKQSLVGASGKPSSPAPTTEEISDKPQGGTGRPTDDDESVPGYFLGVQSIAVQRTEGRATINAPAGTFGTVKGSEVITVWFASDSDLKDAYINAATTEKALFVPGTLLTYIKPSSDGSFTAEFDVEGGGSQVLSTWSEDDGKVGGFYIQNSESVTAARLTESGFTPMSHDKLGD